MRMTMKEVGPKPMALARAGASGRRERIFGSIGRYAQLPGLICACLVDGPAEAQGVGVNAATSPDVRAPSALRRAPTPDFSAVRAFIDHGIATGHVPSMAVAVAQRGRILWEAGFGSPDRENPAPATAHTMYAIASVTKLMTATGLMVLHQRGQLDFDRPVNDYLGSARVSGPVWDPAGATVRRVATHTAGLGTYADDCHFPAPACQDSMIRRYGVLLWRPGDRFDYSNLGYGVLSEVIRHVSKEPYAAFMRDSVFRPLGMSHC
jgi:CubicO group peptidase (beta-lactamase class C family)